MFSSSRGRKRKRVQTGHFNHGATAMSAVDVQEMVVSAWNSPIVVALRNASMTDAEKEEAMASFVELFMQQQKRTRAEDDLIAEDEMMARKRHIKAQEEALVDYEHELLDAEREELERELEQLEEQYHQLMAEYFDLSSEEIHHTTKIKALDKEIAKHDKAIERHDKIIRDTHKEAKVIRGSIRAAVRRYIHKLRGKSHRSVTAGSSLFKPVNDSASTLQLEAEVDELTDHILGLNDVDVESNDTLVVMPSPVIVSTDKDGDVSSEEADGLEDMDVEEPLIPAPPEIEIPVLSPTTPVDRSAPKKPSMTEDVAEQTAPARRPSEHQPQEMTQISVQFHEHQQFIEDAHNQLASSLARRRILMQRLKRAQADRGRTHRLRSDTLTKRKDERSALEEVRSRLAVVGGEAAQVVVQMGRVQSRVRQLEALSSGNQTITVTGSGSGGN